MGKQKVTYVVLSIMEAEFLASARAIQEAIWLRRFLQHLGIVSIGNEVVTIYFDNQATIDYTKDC